MKLRFFVIYCSLVAGSCLGAALAAPARAGDSEEDIRWGKTRDGIQVGLLAQEEMRKGSAITVATVFLRTSRTNASWAYVCHPNWRFSNVSLTNSLSAQIPPNKEGLDRQGNPATSVPLSKFRQVPRSSDRSAGLLRDVLLFGPGVPMRFDQLVPQDLFQVPAEGDYQLSVSPIIYAVSRSTQAAARIDIPCVEIKLHLRANPR